METVSPAQSESGFYSCYFLVPKKDGGLRPILDLRHLNLALMKWPFRMITLKQILSQICPGDWFFSLDLKDAYFHIQIAPPPQAVLEICLRGSGFSIHSPSLWAVPGCPHFYEVHGCSSFPAKIDGNPHPEFPVSLRVKVSSGSSGNPAFSLWSKKEGYLHINCLEMLAVCLGVRTFLPDLKGTSRLSPLG